LCLQDPYDLNPDWDVVRTAGKMKSIEIFLNFMIMDANRNVLWKNPEGVLAGQIERMNAFWGDDSWKTTVYRKQRGLFGDLAVKRGNPEIVQAYQNRLKEVAAFKYVPDPIPLVNSKGATIYYLFFASSNEAGARIAKYIFEKYRKKGAGRGG